MCARIRSLMLLVLLVCRSASAILDGRSAPIILENRYTFTNFEWAQGYVHFKQGFDLPVNGTVIIKLEEGLPMLGNVNLNGGTLILSKRLAFEDLTAIKGNGFIIGNKAKIIFRSATRFDTATYIGLSGDIKFMGSGFGNIDAGGTTLDARNANTLEFIQCTFNDRNLLLTSATNPLSLLFKNCSLRVGPTAWSNPEVIFEGDNNIGITGSTHSFKKITIHPFSSLTVSQQSSIQISELDVQSKESVFRLETADLILRGTSSSAILRLGDHNSTTQGKVVVEGPSTISLSLGSKISVAPSLSVECISGARLTLKKGKLRF